MQAITLKGQSLGSLKVSRPERREELLQRNNRNGCSVCLLAGRQGHRSANCYKAELARGEKDGHFAKKRYNAIVAACPWRPSIKRPAMP